LGSEKIRLNVIDAKEPKRKTVHVILDNYATHKHRSIPEWMERHPCFVFHFTPTSASWLNAVEAQKRLKRGVFRSVQELKDAIHRFLNGINANPKPFTRTKDPTKSSPPSREHLGTNAAPLVHRRGT